jgi:hypothetical protein
VTRSGVQTEGASSKQARLHVARWTGLSRQRLDVQLLDPQGETVATTAAPPDADDLAGLARQVGAHRQPVRAAIESMTGARFVHDELERRGRDVEIADAQKAKGSRRSPARQIGSTPGCSPSSRGASSCRRSGCPTRRSEERASGRAFACSWCASAARASPRHRAPARRRDLAHADPQRALRSGRRGQPCGRLTALDKLRRRSDSPIRLVLPRRGRWKVERRSKRRPGAGALKPTRP